MKKIAVLSIALAAIAMVSCKREEIEDQKGPVVKKTFSATLDHTKAYIGAERYVYWTSADKVAIYDGICSKVNTFTVISGEGTMTANLSGEVCHGATSFIAVSPASAAKGLADGKVTVTVPSVQTAGANNIDESALVMTSSFTGNSFTCKNVNGVFKVTVDVEGINKISIRTNDGSALAGTVTVNPTLGAVDGSASDASPEIILRPSGAAFARGDYYVAALPVTSTTGITVNAFKTDNTIEKVYAKKSTKQLALNRNGLVSLGNFSGVTPKTLLPASIAEQTSSTLTFNLGSTNLDGAHRLALYEDAACTKLVVAHNIPADKINVTDPTHRFVFGGLTQDTVYYFQITNADGTSLVVPAKTEPFTNVLVPENAAVGQVVLAEDFSEISFGGTYNSVNAASWTSCTSDTEYHSGFTFYAPSGEMENANYVNYGNESRVFCALRDAVPSSRLADWAEWMERWDTGNSGIVCPHSGHLKIGANSVIGRIVTPEMKFIPDGESATLEVTFTGARLDTDNPVVQVVRGHKETVGSDPKIDPYNFVIDTVIAEEPVTVEHENWGKYTVRLSGVTKDCRIAIGTKRVNSYNQRFIISDITVKLVSYDSWEDITASYGNDNNINFGNMKMYKTENLNGFAGNVAYRFEVPAGQVGMKVAEKDAHFANDTERKISGTVRKFRNYTMFITYYGAGDIYRPDGINQKYLSPVAYGPDGSGEIKALGTNDGWDAASKAYCPAIGFKDGKVQIKPAITKGGTLYCYSDVKGSDEQLWDVEAAMGGMFHLVHDGQNLISDNTDLALDSYVANWLATPELTTRLVNGQAWVPFKTYAKYRNGRVLVGCTAEGGLIIVAVEKIVDWDNTGKLEDAGHNGINGDTRGVTFYEAAQLMKNLGCSDAMTVEDICWAPVIFQDGGDRGKDLFKTYRRFDLRGDGHFRAESDGFEFVNRVTLCIKAN